MLSGPVGWPIRKQIICGLENITRLQHYFWAKKSEENPVLKKPIFIIGCPRSGTSIFAELYAVHPWVANWSEAGRIWDPVNYFNKESDHHWDSSMVTEEKASRLHSFFEWYRRKNNGKRFVNKHPRSSVRITFIRKIFPDAYFLHVIRDGRAVVNSIINKIREDYVRQTTPFGNFCKPPDWRRYQRKDIIEQTAWQWTKILEHIMENKAELGNRYFEVKYEDFCIKPREIFAAAFKFGELPVSQKIIGEIPSVLKNMNYKYKTELSSSQINTINSIQKDMLGRLGYEV